MVKKFAQWTWRICPSRLLSVNSIKGLAMHSNIKTSKGSFECVCVSEAIQKIGWTTTKSHFITLSLTVDHCKISHISTIDNKLHQSKGSIFWGHWWISNPLALSLIKSENIKKKFFWKKIKIKKPKQYEAKPFFLSDNTLTLDNLPIFKIYQFLIRYMPTKSVEQKKFKKYQQKLFAKW